MNTPAIGLSAAGFLLVMTAWVTYLATIPSGRGFQRGARGCTTPKGATLHNHPLLRCGW